MTITEGQFHSLTVTAIEKLRQSHPEIEYLFEEDGSITVYIEKENK